jgi:hypothetical protein
MRLKTRPQLLTMIRYALADMRAEPLISALTALLYCAIIAPVLLLFVAKVGIISAMVDDLARDTRNREVRIRGEYALQADDLDAIAALATSGFMVPEPAFVVRSWRWRTDGDVPGPLVSLDLRTTRSGDPAFLQQGPWPEGFRQAALSEAAAAALGATVGDTLTVTLRRTGERGGLEVQRVSVTVVAIAPATRWIGETVFVSPDLARAIEEYVWSVVDPGPGWPDAVSRPDAPWKSLRIYAQTVRDAPALRDSLEALGYDTRIRTDQIDNLVRLEGGLNSLFSGVLLVSACGFAAATFLMQWVGAARKRRDYALLVLAGFYKWDVALFPIAQTLVACSVGALLSVAALALMLPSLAAFVAAHTDGGALRLPILGPLGVGYLTVCAIGIAGCVGAVMKILHLDSAEVLRSD